MAQVFEIYQNPVPALKFNLITNIYKYQVRSIFFDSEKGEHLFQYFVKVSLSGKLFRNRIKFKVRFSLG